MDRDPAVQPTLVELTPYECWRLLEQPVGIARVVWVHDDAPAIVLVNYTVAGGALWFQTSPDSRLARESKGQQILVEIDSVDVATRSGWSVVVTGSAESVGVDDVPDILGGLQVWPSGHRPLFLRVAADQVSGRRLHPRH